MKNLIKRAMDLSLAGIGLVLLGPLIGILALAVRLEGSGEIIFKQQRLGRYGRPFTLYKFRKFVDIPADVGPGVTMAKDVRMTRLGEFLERTKLDELPQLWNILRGDMSLVGPRPESVRYQELFVDGFEKVLDYKPGIFGPNQVAFRNESEMYPPDRDPEEYYKNVLFPKKARMDLDYFSRASVPCDLVWMLRGVWVSLSGAVRWRHTLVKHGRIVIVDLAAIVTSWVLANAIRFSGIPDDWNYGVFVTGCWLMPIVILPVLMLGGCYRHPVRLFALVDALRLLVVTSIAWGLAYLILIGLLYRHASVTLAPLGLLIVLPLMLGARVWWREKWGRSAYGGQEPERHRLLVYGAGRRGSALVSLLKQGFPKAQVIGFLDDDDAVMHGRTVQGYKVLGSERDLNTIHSMHDVEQIWVTFIPDDYKYKRLSKWCEEKRAKLVVLPVTSPFSELVEGLGDANVSRLDN